jgi:hypothetical protein
VLKSRKKNKIWIIICSSLLRTKNHKFQSSKFPIFINLFLKKHNYFGKKWILRHFLVGKFLFYFFFNFSIIFSFCVFLRRCGGPPWTDSQFDHVTTGPLGVCRLQTFFLFYFLSLSNLKSNHAKNIFKFY